MKDDFYIGYFSLEKNVNQNGFLGAMLVVDSMSRPVEFRVTFPVKPSAIQKPLYGDAMEPYIGVELCGKQLLDSIDHHLSTIMVNNEKLLGIRDYINSPVLFIQRAGDVIEVDSGNHQFGNKSNIKSASGRFQPITIFSAKNYPEDLSNAKNIIQDMFEDTDLMEPFERIKLAVDTLSDQDERFSF